MRNSSHAFERRTGLTCSVASNHRDALKIARKDRRWLVVQGASDPFGVDDNGETTTKTTRYYETLFDCLGTPEAPGVRSGASRVG